MWLMNRTKKLKEFFGIKRNFRHNISFIDPWLGVFGEIFPSVNTSGNILPNTPRSGSINDKSSLKISITCSFPAKSREPIFIFVERKKQHVIVAKMKTLQENTKMMCAEYLWVFYEFK